MKYRKISKGILSFLLSVLLLAGCENRQNADLFAASTENQETETQPLETGTTEQGKKQGGLIYVQVCGAVLNPGVVTVPEGARVFEAVEKAGGLTEEADERSVNQAEILADGQQIVVLTAEEMTVTSAAPQTREALASGTDKVNLNTADAAALQTLRGIGEAKAADIIAYREANGGFSDIEEIKNISGIKDAVFEKIKDQITV